MVMLIVGVFCAFYIPLYHMHHVTVATTTTPPVQRACITSDIDIDIYVVLDDTDAVTDQLHYKVCAICSSNILM